ncbi:MAG: DUF2637 domain-containing protein [Chloroflexi bacterium]|nr:MAG: DUF2637 domain-containing protein [Chloroflexota bacterium]
MNPAGRVQRRLAQMAGVELGWRLHAGELLAWAVTALALVMSYHAEQDLGQSLKAFRGWPALLWPLSVDIADVGLMVLYLEYKRLRLSTWKVGLGMVAATAVMIAANVRSAWGDPTAVAMQAWVPAIALWLWHTLAAGRKPRGAPIDLGVVWTRVTGGTVERHVEPDALPADTFDEPEQPDQATGEAPAADAHPDGGSSDEPADDALSHVRIPHPRQPARVEVRRLLSRHRGALTGAELRRLALRVHERTGVSIPRARRLIREEQVPHLVTGDQQRSRAGAEAER